MSSNQFYTVVDYLRYTTRSSLSGIIIDRTIKDNTDLSDKCIECT